MATQIAEATPALAAGRAGVSTPRRVTVNTVVTNKPKLVPAAATGQSALQQESMAASTATQAAAGSVAHVSVTGNRHKVSPLQAVPVLAERACTSL